MGKLISRTLKDGILYDEAGKKIIRSKSATHKSMSEEELYQQAKSDPDNPPLTEAELEKFKLVNHELERELGINMHGDRDKDKPDNINLSFKAIKIILSALNTERESQKELFNSGKLNEKGEYFFYHNMPRLCVLIEAFEDAAQKIINEGEK